MDLDLRNLRLDGIYRQRQEGYFMQRVKLPAGVISAHQARMVATVAERFGRGMVHLTTRGSMEIHWLKGEDLPAVKREFAKVGLTSRGACGGAVRGVTCSAGTTVTLPLLESLARRLQRHFTGNPRYETLPKKFKIGIEADTVGGRHLIQDVGLVLAATGEEALYDVWIAGGLGREPQAGFCLEKGVVEARLIPLIEAVIAVYARLAPPPKRLKYLARQLGEAELRRLVEAEPAHGETLAPPSALGDSLTGELAGGERIVLPVFAGQLKAELLADVATFADRHAGGVLQVTVDQDIACIVGGGSGGSAARELADLSRHLPGLGGRAVFRVCPGNHECAMGLAPTREIAADLVGLMGAAARKLGWAISGCPNSCSQPQLAAAGIVVSRLVDGENGEKEPRFDLYRRRGAGLGEKEREQLTGEELAELVTSLADA
jgi:ferredoxin-nitrite reductase